MVKVKRTTEGKICTKCGKFKKWDEFASHVTKMDGHAYECRDCGKEHSRLYYQAHKEKWRVNERLSQVRHPQKWKARALVREAIRVGNLHRESCHICFDPKTEAHHPDYSKPLTVMWLCKKHHMEQHRKYGVPNIQRRAS